MGEVKMIEIPDGNTTHDFTDIVIDFTKDTENHKSTYYPQISGLLCHKLSGHQRFCAR
ncbi:MAG: hypothetical protein IPJ13_06795 [Saprospiraceae bacterium]|nr:hypothetical protein [Saprospiraceae bacterium]